MARYAIVGVGGKLGAGKDAFADHLVNTYGWQKMGMSDPLLDYALILNPWVRVGNRFMRARELVEEVGYTEAKRVSEDFREFLQTLGTGVGRDIDIDLWVNKAAARAQQYAETNHVIITGIRFQNELERIKKLGGVLVYIHRPGLPEGEKKNYHESENSVEPEDFDEIVYNEGELSDLYREVDLFVTRLHQRLAIYEMF